MVTSLLRDVEGLGAHQSINKDRVSTCSSYWSEILFAKCDLFCGVNPTYGTILVYINNLYLIKVLIFLAVVCRFPHITKFIHYSNYVCPHQMGGLPVEFPKALQPGIHHMR